MIVMGYRECLAASVPKTLSSVFPVPRKWGAHYI
jgi:hypothetical protein